jgi:hypothetical protein
MCGKVYRGSAEQTIISSWRFSMNFTGTDLHTNKFTCCYRDGKPSAGDPRIGKEIKTFPLGTEGLAAFYQTLTPQTYALAEAAVTVFAFARHAAAVSG